MEIYDYQIITNLLSGRGFSKDRLLETIAYLKAKGLTFTELSVSRPTPISLLPQNNKVKITRGVIVIGGDGTVSETIGFMAKKDLSLPLYLIPTGTANYLARSLGISAHRSIETLGNVLPVEYDLGIYETKDDKGYFLIGIGLGYEQRFIALTKDHYKKFFRSFGYFLSAFRELFNLKPEKYQLLFDQQKNVEVFSPLLLILNLRPKNSFFFPLFPEKEIISTDGVLDLVYLEHKNYFKSLLGILSFHLLGRVNFGLVKRVQISEIEIRSSAPVLAQIDGEEKGSLPLKICLLPNKIKFLV